MTPKQLADLKNDPTPRRAVDMHTQEKDELEMA
jgi:hypothetical protein